MTLKAIDPLSLGRPKGYSNGMLSPAGGRVLFVAGQVAWNERQEIVSDDFAAQFGQALANVVAVVRQAGGAPENLARLTIFVTNKQAYLEDLKGVGAAYRAVMGQHYPAMSLIEIKGLIEPGAMVEIEGTAILPTNSGVSEAVKLALYQAAQSSAQHHDQLLWVATNIIWAGSLLLLGVVVTRSTHGCAQAVLALGAVFLHGFLWSVHHGLRSIKKKRYEQCKEIEAAISELRVHRDTPTTHQSCSYGLVQVLFMLGWGGVIVWCLCGCAG